jgi:DNA helicase-2/ATP-dependent DNA helicase PcrA
MSDFLTDLNANQREAVEYGIGPKGAPGGPLLIIAGAGTGKTNTLAYRVAHLIRSGADPGRILLLTFTRRAADEMSKRATRILAKARAADTTANASPGRITWAGTFHAIANRLLRIHAESIGLDASFTVMDRSDSEDLMNKLRNDLGYAKKDKRFPRKGTCLAIYSHVVNTRQSVENSINTHFPWCAGWTADLHKLFGHFTAAKQRINVLDYDDLLLYWFHLMHEPALAAAEGNRFDHVLVDEYQDTNILQADILLKTKPAGQGLTVVGDDGQSIYSFRAADVRNILDFPAQFTPAARVITLEQNYRSTQPVLQSCNAVMAQAEHRFTKNLHSQRPSAEKPFLVCAEDESYQVEYVVQNILQYREAGIDLRQQAVLFRAAHHSAELEIELARRNIPFVKYGGLKFLEAAHVKDMICVLRCAENPRDAVALFRVLLLIEGMGPVAAARAIAWLEQRQWDYAQWPAFKAPAAAAAAWPAFCRLLVTLRQTAWEGQVGLVRQWYTPILYKNYDAPDIRDKDVAQLEQLATGFRTRESFLTDLTLDPPDAVGDEAGVPLLDDDYLILSTIHSAKGQEWKTVFILNLADGWIPSDMATGRPEQIEEERRLLYVAMTRAKDHLHLIQPQRFYTHNHKHRHGDSHVYSTTSRFLTRAVIETVDRVFHGRGRDEDKSGTVPMEPVDIKARLRDMWEMVPEK